MKIGRYPVKHTYKIPRMIADVFSVALMILIVSGTVGFFKSYNALMLHLGSFGGDNAEQIAQQFSESLTGKYIAALIFPVLGLAVLAAYIILVLKSHKFSGYNVTKLTAQKYYDLYAFCASLCKIPALLGIFDIMYIADQRMLGNTEISLFSVQVLCDILLIIIIIRMGMHRAKSYEPQEQAHEEAAASVVKVRAVKKKDKGTEDET